MLEDLSSFQVLSVYITARKLRETVGTSSAENAASCSDGTITVRARKTGFQRHLVQSGSIMRLGVIIPGLISFVVFSIRIWVFHRIILTHMENKLSDLIDYEKIKL